MDKVWDIFTAMINLTIAGLIAAMIGMAMAPEKTQPIKRLKPAVVHLVKGEAKAQMTSKGPGSCRLEWKEGGKNPVTGAWLPFKAKANLEREAREMTKKSPTTLLVEVYCK